MPKFNKRDFDVIAEFVSDEHSRRKRERKDKEKQWDEIDRQIEMQPDVAYKKKPNGSPDEARAWMSEMELPLQAQTLEVLTSDARRMMDPDSGNWFAAHSALTDEYLERVDFESMIAGDENDVPTKVNQDNADKIVEGWLNNFHRQYDFWGNIDQINAESFKYGVGIGRVRLAKKTVFLDNAQGMEKRERKIPVIVPRCIRDVFLDDSPHNLTHEGHIVGPGVIFSKTQSLEDLRQASRKGIKDPYHEDGGWMPANLKNIEPDSKGYVKLLEFEGDMVIPRKTTRSMFYPNLIVTVAQGKESKGVVRLRFRKYPFASYIQFPYHRERVDDAYATSPLMKGWPVQMAATQALNRLMDAAALKTEPPIGYDRTDPVFASQGGPAFHPGAQIGSNEPVQVHDFADPAAMLQAYVLFLQQYYDVTGVNAPRLGAQTNSHTTAFAKDVENSRGQSRTVDYVRSTLKGPMTQLLYMEYVMGLDVMEKSTIYLPAYRGFVDLKKEHLPDLVYFEAFGAGGPAEELQKKEAKMAALNMAMQIDTMKAELGMQPEMNFAEVQRQILTEGGWSDVDPFFNDGTESVPPGTSAAPAMAGDTGGGPAAPIAEV